MSDTPTQPKPPSFATLNPYKDATDKVRFVSNIDRNVYNFFYSIAPGVDGLQQTTINILISKLYAKLKLLGIEPGSPNSGNRFIETVINCDIIIPGKSSESPNGPSEGRNDSRPTPRSVGTSATTQNAAPSLPVEPNVRKRRAGRKGKEGTANDGQNQ